MSGAMRRVGTVRLDVIERELRERLRRIYVDGWDYWGNPTEYTERKERQLASLRECIARGLGSRAEVQTVPMNINNSYELECPLGTGLPDSRFEVEPEQLARAGRIEYFQLLLSVVAPVVAGVWHRFFLHDGEVKQEIYDLLSEEWFAMHPEHERVALEIMRVAEEQGNTVLGWDVTMQPADKDWPATHLMPEEPEFRHYLFKGYYDDWAGITKPVHDA